MEVDTTKTNQKNNCKRQVQEMIKEIHKKAKGQ